MVNIRWSKKPLTKNDKHENNKPYPTASNKHP
jgi:hypothetical protein